MIYLTYELIRAWMKYELDHTSEVAPAPWLPSGGTLDAENLHFNKDFDHTSPNPNDPIPWVITFGADEDTQSITRPKTVLISPTLTEWPKVVDCHGMDTQPKVKDLAQAYVTVEITIIVGGPVNKFRPFQGNAGGGGQNPASHLALIQNLYKGAFQTASLAANKIDLLVAYSGDSLTSNWARMVGSEDPTDWVHNTEGMRITEQPPYLKGRLIKSEFLSEQWGVADPGPTPVFITKTFRCLVERGPFGE